MKNNITITQIAKESEVSIATVSRFLNGNVTVSEKKRKRIEKVVKKYDFTPNAMARSLILKKTMTLGVVLPDITNPYFSSLFIELQRHAQTEGYSLLLFNTRFHHGTCSLREEDYFQFLLDKQVDGAIILGGQVDLVNVSKEYLISLNRLNHSLPTVVVGRTIPDCSCTFLELENGRCVKIAYDYLYALGHRDIAFIGGQPGVNITEIRLQTYQNAILATNNIPDERLISLSDYYTKDGYEAARTLLNRNVSFTAAIVMNDNVALGSIRAFHDAGLSVPENISIISCVQFHSSEYYTPRLSTIRHHNEFLGSIIIQTMLKTINNTLDTAPLLIPPELIIRQSYVPIKI